MARSRKRPAARPSRTVASRPAKPARKATRKASRIPARKAPARRKPAAPAVPPVPWGGVAMTEISSWDADATRGFLADVFGWSFQDASGPARYAVGGPSGQPIAGLRPLMAEEPAPACTPYLTVKNLGATLGAVEMHGGKVMVPPMPVEKRGWFFWFQAPGGPVLACWQDDRKAPARKT